MRSLVTLAVLAIAGSGAAQGAPAECALPATRIHSVQGAGLLSPLVGETVTIQGVVVADFQAADGDRPFGFSLGGFFVQERDATADDDARTSEGIFVADRQPRAVDVAVGDLLRVTGRVQEAGELTRLEGARDVTVCDAGVPLPTPTVVTLPVAGVADLEALEGMRVVLPQELVISEYFNFDRFGEIVLAVPQPGMERPYQPTHYLDPDDPEFVAHVDRLARSRITLDDGRSFQNPDPARHPNGRAFDLDNLFRGGDRVRNVVGVMDHAFGLYRIQPTGPAEHIVANPRPARPADVGGDVKVAVFNVLNYFETLTSGGSFCGPAGRDECRGADDEVELRRQRDKLVAAITVSGADVVALLEIENDSDQGALRDLVSALNADDPGAFAYVDSGPMGPDTIRVALIYKPAAVRTSGAHAVLAGEFLDPNATGRARNRPALAQTFTAPDGSGAFTAVVSHFKSKGEACLVSGDDDPRQGNCNRTRALAAELLVAWVAQDPTGSGSADALLLGDFNGYAREDPIRVLRAGPDGVNGTADDLTDLLAAFEGEEAYTFVFDGQYGYLDYAFASPSLMGRVTNATAWHINADESDLIDYDTTFKLANQDALYAPDPYRSSDHDPVIVGILMPR